jgi:hypothetical protein
VLEQTAEGGVVSVHGRRALLVVPAEIVILVEQGEHASQTRLGDLAPPGVQRLPVALGRPDRGQQRAPLHAARGEHPDRRDPELLVVAVLGYLADDLYHVAATDPGDLRGPLEPERLARNGTGVVAEPEHREGACGLRRVLLHLEHQERALDPLPDGERRDVHGSRHVRKIRDRGVP